MTGAPARHRTGDIAKAVALVAFVVLAPILLVVLAGAVPASRGGGPSFEESSAALGGVQRLVQAGAPERVDPLRFEHVPAAPAAPAPCAAASTDGIATHAAPFAPRLASAPVGARANRRL